MKERIIFGAVGAVLAVLAFLYASSNLVFALVAIIALMALTEFLKAVSILNTSKLSLNILTYLSAIAILAVMYLNSGHIDNYGLLIPVISIHIILSFIIMVTNHSSITFIDVAVSIVGNIYITVSLVHIYLIRLLPDGKMYLWLPFIIAWSTDTFAYFTGVFLGKHKLIPSVSPKKTIEGAIGGTLGAVVIVAVYQLICSKIAYVEPDYLMGVVISLVCSVASQFGDLAASCIKREHGIKDFGSIMPGHGGVMDRFDSVIFISPLVYIFVYYIGIF